MDRFSRLIRLFRRTVTLLAALLLLAPAAPAAQAEGRAAHVVVLQCAGEGFVGTDARGNVSGLKLDPSTGLSKTGGWTLERLAELPDFRLEAAALRFRAEEAHGPDFCYTLSCGTATTYPQHVLAGVNLWDVTSLLSVWLEAPESRLSLLPTFREESFGFRVAEGSVCLQIAFTASGELPRFATDHVSQSPELDHSLALLEADSPFLLRYEETAESLVTALLPLGVPYYYAGGSEDKFLHRFYPDTNTRYYLPEHMYLCGLDCVGMTRLVFEKSGLARHPSISDLLRRGIGSRALKENDPSRWPLLLQPGDLVAVKHGTYHIMIYAGTLRQFGWSGKDAGEAETLLDAPLVIHCGGNPFYYDRYQEYIRNMGYRNTMPPDGGVTVSVIRETNSDAPHSLDTFWGKHFGWYELGDGSPLLVFPLDDCTDMAWYGPLPAGAGEAEEGTESTNREDEP